MSCLKSAAMIFGNLDEEPEKKIDLTVAAATHFEKYISDGLPDKLSYDPGIKDHPCQLPGCESGRNGLKTDKQKRLCL
jgi:hypothetical protein